MVQYSATSCDQIVKQNHPSPMFRYSQTHLKGKVFDLGQSLIQCNIKHIFMCYLQE